MTGIQGIPGKSPESPGTSWDSLGTPLGPSVDASGTLQGLLGTSTDYKNNNISTNSQRQKLSIAASESVRCNASPQRAQGPPRQP